MYKSYNLDFKIFTLCIIMHFKGSVNLNYNFWFFNTLINLNQMVKLFCLASHKERLIDGITGR